MPVSNGKYTLSRPAWPLMLSTGGSPKKVCFETETPPMMYSTGGIFYYKKEYQEYVTDTDKSDSYAICNSFVEHASDEVLRIFEGGSVKIIDRPEQEPTTIAANSYKRGVIGFVIGVILAVFALFLLDMFDTRIEGSEELIEKYGLPILGEIPNLSDV